MCELVSVLIERWSAACIHKATSANVCANPRRGNRAQSDAGVHDAHVTLDALKLFAKRTSRAQSSRAATNARRYHADAMHAHTSLTWRRHDTR
jgi:hypothetical protein